MKFAVTDFAELTVIVHDSPLGASQPLRLANTDPAEAVAVNVIIVPERTDEAG